MSNEIKYTLLLKQRAICLHAAAMKGHTNVVRALLQKGATPDSKTKVSNTRL
jgi:ankyrin repeat protein